MNDDDLLAAGLRERREVLGDDHVDRALADSTGFGAGFQEVLTRFAWGSVWTRPGLSRRERRLLTIALLAGLGRLDELAVHVRAAREDGLDAATVEEVLVHTAVYAGIPAANAAVAAVRPVVGDSA
jgi:4-carboxymuconolactone decarboxylase